ARCAGRKKSPATSAAATSAAPPSTAATGLGTTPVVYHVAPAASRFAAPEKGINPCIQPPKGVALSTLESQRAATVPVQGNGHYDGMTRVFLQPIAAPSILGLYGFAGA